VPERKKKVARVPVRVADVGEGKLTGIRVSR